MKLPSVSVLLQNFKSVVTRFPLQVLLALVATGLWCHLAGTGVIMEQNQGLIKLLLFCNLGLTLLLALDTYAESHALSSTSKWLLRVLALALLAGLYFLIDPFRYLTDIFRVALFAFAFHLLVAFAPFIKRGNLNGFWQYNKTLFLRVLISAFYAAVLFAGLAIALFAIDGLFNVTIKSDVYLRLFIVLSAGFMTIFFLAGVPSNFQSLEEEQSYPKGLKIFTQYVLIPLMTIYLAILLVYEVKIAINWELPKGLVSTLILGYAVFGILSLLLIYPIREKDGNGWMKLFFRFFYLMMVPLIVLLILAVIKRVGNYGITESRYILIILAAWLTGITAYFLFSKKQNIKVIPISLFVVAILAIYGPQSAFSVSKASQISRLRNLMDSKSQEEKEEIPSVVRYLVDRHGLTSLHSFTTANLNEIEKKIYAKAEKNKSPNYEIESEKVDTAFALLKVKDMDNSAWAKYVTFTNEESVVNVRGYDGLMDLNDYSQEPKTFNGEKFEIEKGERKDRKGHPQKKVEKLTVKIAGKEAVVFNVDSLARQLVRQNEQKSFKKTGHETFSVPSTLLQMKQETRKYNFTFVARDLSGNYRRDERTFNWLNFGGYLLIKKN
ncbi:DUF4153 domain-containing protein [Pedobacter sp.]|uniref:DUF4153 domain-containing protein n=1 Tax=Pedobacter sp. TaxID=1411316 RepID=UPI0031D1F90B